MVRDTFSIETGGGGPGKDLATANNNNPDHRNRTRINNESWLHWLYHSKRSRLFTVAAIFVIGFVADLGTSRTTDYMISGGAIGVFFSTTVMCLSLHRYRDFQLLFWRSFADFGVALRFVLTKELNQLACHSDYCHTNGKCAVKVSAITSHQFNELLVLLLAAYPLVEYCGFPSAFLEFFEIASELWFGCVAYDILASLVDPFSSTKNRMWMYHVFVWTISLAFAVPTWVFESVHGYWYIANGVDNTAICWIKAHKNHISTYIYVMFYIPLLLVYLFAVNSVFVAYQRLRNGISNTLIHRMRALVVNALTVSLYLLYWFVAGITLLSAYSANSSEAARFNERLLLYMIASKGVSCYFVWILTQDVSFNFKSGGSRNQDDKELLETEGVDLGSALRSELLYFATSGIRNTARRSSSLKLDATNPSRQHILQLQHPAQQTTDQMLSLSFFFFLMMGRETERREIARMAIASRKKASIGADFLSDKQPMVASNSVPVRSDAGEESKESMSHNRQSKDKHLSNKNVVFSQNPMNQQQLGSGRPKDLRISDNTDGIGIIGGTNPMVKFSLVERPSTEQPMDNRDSETGDPDEERLSQRFVLVCLCGCCLSCVWFSNGKQVYLNVFRMTVSSKREHKSILDMSEAELEDVERASSRNKSASMGSKSNVSSASMADAEARRGSDLVVTSISDGDASGDSGGGVRNVARSRNNRIVGRLLGTCFGINSPEVFFTEIEPFHFRRVRLSQGVTDLDYIQYVGNNDLISRTFLSDSCGPLYVL
jgi:hypothetical protein